MIVKVCGITNAMDALVALDAGADALGFNFWEGSPRFLREPAFLKDLPDDFWRVGLFVNEEPGKVADLMVEYRLDVAQLHRMNPIDGLRVWKAVAVDHEMDQAEIASIRAEAIVLDTPSRTLEGGTGQTFDWALARGLNGKIVLAGGLDGANVAHAIRTLKPWGVDACSRLESAPGKKDPDKLRTYVEAARQEFETIC